MPTDLIVADTLAAGNAILEWLTGSYLFLKVLIGFSVIIFVHELGHFLAAKWMGVRVDRFAVGFFYRLAGYRRGEGFTFGPAKPYTPDELEAKGFGETDYCINALPFGGYVKMLGQDDIQINEETGEVSHTDDPRAFTNKTVGQRMIVVSAGVLFNLFFAVLAYALVYMSVGRTVLAPIIGDVQPGSAAAKAGLMSGDHVVSIDGNEVRSFNDIQMSWALADDQMRFTVERDGAVVDEPIILDINRRESDGEKEPIGVTPMFTRQVGVTSEPGAADTAFQPGDVITHINGEQVASSPELAAIIRRSVGEPMVFTVERPAGKGDKTETVAVTIPPRLRFLSARPDDDAVTSIDNQHMLGLVRRQTIQLVSPGTPAERAGFKPGDVVAQWGTVANPLYSEIKASIRANVGRPVPVVVLRDGQREALEVTPQRPFSLFGSEPPRIGVAFVGEEERAVIADVVPGTPAAGLGLPRGARIVAVDDQPVQTWTDVYNALSAAAGETVTLLYRTGEDKATAQLDVPPSVVSALDLPNSVRIQEIAGEKSAVLSSGRAVNLPSVSAVQRLLEQHMGETVTVKYIDDRRDTEPTAAEFTITPENVDPWQLRIVTQPPVIHLEFATSRAVTRNPVEALWFGLRDTGHVLTGVYRFIKNFATQNVGVKHVAGPVGIFKMAYQEAAASWGDLLVFLAFISINLAVINFLPLPVVDGGLMIFLLLEKIRGKPVSIKVQVITTLAGLGLIVLTFLVVTIQDVTRLLSG